VPTGRCETQDPNPKIQARNGKASFEADAAAPATCAPKGHGPYHGVPFRSSGHILWALIESDVISDDQDVPTFFFSATLHFFFISIPEIFRDGEGQSEDSEGTRSSRNAILEVSDTEWRE
jgi:hypothetical protein